MSGPWQREPNRLRISQRPKATRPGYSRRRYPPGTWLPDPYQHGPTGPGPRFPPDPARLAEVMPPAARGRTA